MAGERLAKLTVRVALSHNDIVRGGQTTKWTFSLDNQVIDLYRGGQPGQFTVPDPDSFLSGELYVLQAVQNALGILAQRISALGLPYTISTPRQVGTIGSFYDSSPQAPIVEFSLTATSYGKSRYANFDPNWSDQYFAGAFEVISLGNISPIFGQATVTDATYFGAADGHIEVTATSDATDGPFGLPRLFAYDWADGATGAVRQNLAAGTYPVTITNGTGASTTLTPVVRSDARLDVQVQQVANSVHLVVTGGLAPYTYAWLDGATTADRTGLAPGYYGCTVTDSRGIQVTVGLTVDLINRFYWSRNPVTLYLQAASPGTKPNLRFLCRVFVELDYLSGVFHDVAGVLAQPADSAGRTTFDVSTLLDAYVGPDFPAWGEAGLVRADRLWRRFYLEHSEQWDGSSDPTFSVRQTYYLLYGGLDFFETATQSYFNVYRPSVKPFLTWEPTQKEVFADQPEYLYYQHDRLDAGYFGVQVRLTSLNGRQSTFLLHERTDARCFEVWRFAVGRDQLLRALPLLAAPLQFDALEAAVAWEVTVVDAGGQPLSETRAYQLSDELPALRRYFLYAGSLGGVGTLATVGKGRLEVDFSNVLVQRSLLPGYDATQGETYTASVSGVPVLRVGTGHLHGAALEALRDCLLSEEVRYYDTDRYRPGSWQPLSTLPLADDDEPQLAVELAFVLPTWHRHTPTLPQRY